MLAEKNRDIKKAYDLLQIISKDEKARMLYEAEQAEISDQLTRIKSAEKKGKEEGIREGIREGIKEGIIRIAEKEANLSQNKDCWVGGNAKVFDNAWIYNNAMVFHNAQVFGFANVYDNAKVYGNAHVFDHACISGEAKVCEEAKVCGKAVIVDNAEVKEMSDYMVFQNNWSSGRNFTWTKSNDMWIVGCFYGTGEELIEKAYKDSEESGKNYEKYVKFVETFK